MDAMNLDEWLRDTDVEPPCGPNLEYDESFMSLMNAAAGKPEQQYGDTVIPAEGPDWPTVRELALALARTGAVLAARRGGEQCDQGRPSGARSQQR